MKLKWCSHPFCCESPFLTSKYTSDRFSRLLVLKDLTACRIEAGCFLFSANFSRHANLEACRRRAFLHAFLYFPISGIQLFRPVEAGFAMRDAFALMLTVLLCMVSLVHPPCTQAGPEKTNLILGAKRIAGPYYPSAGAIADGFNHQRSRHGMRITIRTNRPSASIVASVLSGEFEFGAVHLSRIHNTYNGLGLWHGRPKSVLRDVPGVFKE